MAKAQGLKVKMDLIQAKTGGKFCRVNRDSGNIVEYGRRVNSDPDKKDVLRNLLSIPTTTDPG
jgi:hypothetical protein